MRVRISLAVLIFAACLAGSAAALELVAPAPSGVLKEGKVYVIGKAPKADKGKVEFAGQSTSFRVKDGVFTVAINLTPGRHEVRFSTGEETLTADWTVDPAAKEDVYVYHSDITTGGCKSCHDEGATIPSTNDNVSALCHRCHGAYDKAPFVHGPVAMGLCAACHQPHGSPHAPLLRIGREDLCTDCHNQPITAKHREYQGAQCLECHRPHASEKRYFLK